MDRTTCDVYDVGVIRKQLYISEAHDRALKLKARELGLSEAELVRRLLDRLLVEQGDDTLVPGRTKAALDFLEETDRIAGSHRFPDDYRFDREELYGDRAGT